MKKSFLLFVLALFASSVCFAYTKNGTVYTTDGSRGDVNAAVVNASTGDTISIPSGTFAWDSAVAITKNVTIQGAGPASTTLQRSSGQFFTVDITTAFFITGIHFEGSGTAGNFVYITNKATGFRINNNRFNNTVATSTSGVYFYVSALSEGQPSGVIDNNTFNNSKVVVIGPTTTPYALTMYGPTRLGTDNTVYVENNTIDRTLYCETGAAGNAVDSHYGMSYVFRFNTVIDANLEVHSSGGGDLPDRAGRYWEIYNNTLSLDTAACGWNRAMFIRGGTGVIFNNTITSGYDSPRIDLDVHGARWGSCTGSSTADGNTPGESGWPCRDQIGRASDAFLWTSGGSVPSQASEPAYFWNNTNFANTTVTYAGDDAYIVQDRDYYEDDTAGMSSGVLASIPGTCTVGQGYWATDQGSWNQSGSGGQGVLYKCTSTNTWTLYYTPYAYPHPLAAGEAGWDTTPTAFAFTDNVDVGRTTVIYSTSITVLGIDNVTSITSSGTGCSYQVNGAGDWLTTGGDNVSLNDTIQMKVTSSGSYATDTPCTLTLNSNVADVWHVTTLAAPGEPGLVPTFPPGVTITGGVTVQ